MKKALITGITGQDGSYLAEFLLEKGYEVHGFVRPSSTLNTFRIQHILDKIIIHFGDMTDFSSIISVVKEIQPDEIYNLAAQSFVQTSFFTPEYISNVDALGVLRILEAVRFSGIEDKCKIYQASTSELFGNIDNDFQSETTNFQPCSPYAVAKQYGYWITKQYRESYSMFVCNGIMFNHESERRGYDFVTRKITLGVGKIAYGLQDYIELGNLNSKRDWGYAKDYVECMWLILQQEAPDDYVIATGTQHTIKEFVEFAFSNIGVTIVWKGEGLDEKGYDKDTGVMRVCVNKKYYRISDVNSLKGDSRKAEKILGWNPNKTSCEELCKIMVEHDLEIAKKMKGDINTILY